MSEKKMFFSVTDGVLMLEFEGTVEELRADFDKKVADFVRSIEEQVKKLEKDKQKLSLPECFDKLTKERQVAVDLDFRAKVAAKDAEIAMAKKQIEKAKAMSIKDVKYFVLNPIEL